MSISAVLLDGARRAATYAALLFSLNSPPPVDAPPPEPACVVRGDAGVLPGRADMAALCEDADLSADAAEQVETASAR